MGVSQADDERFMTEALALAARGAGLVSPNPMVGCVLVKDGAVIGRGWHRGAGQAHAEVEALLEAGEKAKGATAYVTLEPCNHHGRTGPCTEALINAGVREVVYAVADPNPTAAGGADTLRRNGVIVRNGVGSTQGAELNRAWLHAVRMQRPFVIAKSAMTLDGRIATHTNESQWITGPEARAKGHELRWTADAIIAGAGTIIADDPALTARRDNDEIRHPLRVVTDSIGRTPVGAKAFERSGNGALIIATPALAAARQRQYEEMGVDIEIAHPGPDGRPDPDDIVSMLHKRGVVTAMIEGGGELLGAFFGADLIDELHLFVAPKIFGGGKPAFGGEGVSTLRDAERFDFDAPLQLGPDLYLRGVRRQESA